MRKRVAITGVGLISSLGATSELFHQKLCDGTACLGQIAEYEHHGLASQPGGKVFGFQPELYLKGKPLRPLDRTGRLVASAAKQALENSGWTTERLASHDVGLVLGTMFGSIHTIAEFDRQALIDGPASASPMDFANTVINSAAGQTAIWHKLRGINSTTATGATSGLTAISYAADLIRYGRQTTILAGGADEFCFETFYGLHRAGLLCGPASKGGYPIPFDQRRSGLALAEAAALLVLEEWETAAMRGAVVLGEVRGHGTSYNPLWEQVGCRSHGIVCAMRRAMEDARLSPSDIDCISASANGSVVNDENEALAIAAVFNAQSPRIPVTAIKSVLGETLGAAGALQAIDFLATTRTSLLPGIAGLGQVNPQLGNLNLCRRPAFLNVRSGLINSVGFDGHACSLIVSTLPT